MASSLMSPIDWSADHEPQLFLNHRWSDDKRKLWRREFENHCSLAGGIAVATSGTTSSGQGKFVVLTRQGFLESARAVNEHLISVPEDKWLHLLPDFHVGGLAIWARAFLSQAEVIKPQGWVWSIDSFRQLVAVVPFSLLSLVPTQVFDIVQAEIKAPRKLRAVIVGGGALDPVLYSRARELGWPLLPSYGLTECASQVATARLESLNSMAFPESCPLLDHIEAQVDRDDILSLKSTSLLAGYFLIDDERWVWQDPKVSGWFKTQDRVILAQRQIQFLGRDDDQFKIKGELVSLSALRAKLVSEALRLELSQEVTLAPIPHTRDGWELLLVYSEKEISVAQAENLRIHLNRDLLPYQRVGRCKGIPIIPRAALGKVPIIISNLKD